MLPTTLLRCSSRTKNGELRIQDEGLTQVSAYQVHRSHATLGECLGDVDKRGLDEVEIPRLSVISESRCPYEVETGGCVPQHDRTRPARAEAKFCFIDASSGLPAQTQM